MAGGMWNKIKNMFNNDYDDYSGEEYNTSESGSASNTAAVHEKFKSHGNLVAMPSVASVPKSEIVICSVINYEDLKMVGGLLKKDKCVIVSFETNDDKLKRRFEDYLFGFSSATGGDKARLSDDLLIFTPPAMILTKPFEDSEQADPRSTEDSAGYSSYPYRY